LSQRNVRWREWMGRVEAVIFAASDSDRYRGEASLPQVEPTALAPNLGGRRCTQELSHETTYLPLGEIKRLLLGNLKSTVDIRKAEGFRVPSGVRKPLMQEPAGIGR